MSICSPTKAPGIYGVSQNTPLSIAMRPEDVGHPHPHPHLHALTCFGEERGHAPGRQQHSAHDTHLRQEHLPPLAHSEMLGDHSLFGYGATPLQVRHGGGRPCAFNSKNTAADGRDQWDVG